mgnify:CR=1 FL=1
MPARTALVTIAELESFLNVSSGTDTTLLTALLDEVQTLFEAACNRHERPFAASASRTEVQHGTGTASLFLDYPATAITSVKLGYDPAVPDETLDPADKTVVIWGAGADRLTRVDGGVFGTLDQPRYVQVVYTTGELFPAPARLAVLRGTATVYRQRGSEDARAERIGGYSTDLAKLLEDHPEWQAGIAACWVPRV